jgi:hypothetical protein
MKLEAKDIRVGNLFNHLDNWSYRQPKTDYKEFVFKWDESDWYALGECTLSLEDIDPIELTEDWLVRCGFEYEGQVIENQYEKFDRYILHNPNRSKPNYEVHFMESCYGGQFHKEIIYSFDIDERQRVFQTDYVHNLQNHFQISMGEELTIKIQ